MMGLPKGWTCQEPLPGRRKLATLAGAKLRGISLFSGIAGLDMAIDDLAQPAAYHFPHP